MAERPECSAGRGRWDGDTTGRKKQTYTVERGDPARYKLFDGDIVVLAFLPQRASIARIGDPPSVRNLANSMNVESVAPPTP